MITVAKSEIHSRFCEAFKARRVELGLTQAQVAERLGVATAYVTQVEKGRTEPALSTAERFAQAVDSTLADLVASHAHAGH